MFLQMPAKQNEIQEARSCAQNIPEALRTCFWDTDLAALDVQRNKSFIIARLYTKGGIAGISWVHQTYTDEDIAAAAKTRRDLNPIVANYLRKKYGLKKENMMYYRAQCLSTPRR